MSKLRRYSLDPAYDPMGDCQCYPTIEEDDNGEYVLYGDYMKLLREYSEAITNEGNKTCANPLCDNRADMYLGERAYCCNCLQPRMERERVQDTSNG